MPTTEHTVVRYTLSGDGTFMIPDPQMPQDQAQEVTFFAHACPRGTFAAGAATTFPGPYSEEMFEDALGEQ